MGAQRIVSMGFLIVALALFVAMNFLPTTKFGEGLGWKMWPEIWWMSKNPANLSDGPNAVAYSSFLTFSLLITASPFLGNAWVKSLLAWSISVIFSGVAAAGFWVLIFTHNSAEDLRLGAWCLLMSPVLNFIGLLLARPQWLKKPGLP